MPHATRPNTARSRTCYLYVLDLIAIATSSAADRRHQRHQLEDIIMKTWTKPAVREQEVGLEVTSYLPAEIDVI